MPDSERGSRGPLKACALTSITEHFGDSLLQRLNTPNHTLLGVRH